MSQTMQQRFGKYILMRKIAEGGMAEIFKAKAAGAEGFEKDLVIKRILPHFTEDDAFVKMFIDEASITAKLQHPNIVQIFDFDVVDSMYFIAMEYIEGQDLKDVMRACIKHGERLSVAQVVWILMEVSKGLHYAHTREHHGEPLNIVHRDVTPANIMVSYGGEVKLMDFGIAKAAQRSTKTMAGAVKGKVAYMSPEQARGKSLDGRSDLFALATMAWEMLTNKRLFLADSDFETLTNVLRAEAPAPSQYNKDVPQDLEFIILRALEKQRDARYANVEAFNRELTRWYYSNVVDLEKEKLKPLMRRVFAGEIAELARMNAEEQGEAAEELLSGARESTVSMPAGDMKLKPPSEERTRLDTSAADFEEPDESEARTVAIQAPQRPMRAAKAEPARTDQAEDAPQEPVAPPTSGRKKRPTLQQRWEAEGKAPKEGGSGSVAFWVVLIVVVLGGGGAALFFLI